MTGRFFLVFQFSATFDPMKKFPVLFLLFSLLACDDGDLQIAVIDFDSASIQYCDNTLTESTTFFFKLNTEEALVLVLQSGLLQPVETTEPLSSSIPGQSQVTYRTFSDAVSSGYFCDDIPPTSPDVILDVSAAAGEVLINTVRNAADTTLFEHTISIQNLSLITENNERITDLTAIEFGTISIPSQ